MLVWYNVVCCRYKRQVGLLRDMCVVRREMDRWWELGIRGLPRAHHDVGG